MPVLVEAKTRKKKGAGLTMPCLVAHYYLRDSLGYLVNNCHVAALDESA